MDINSDQAKGRVKEAAGALIGDDDLKNEGKADQKGRYWRAGMVILTPDDLLARADRYRRRAA